MPLTRFELRTTRYETALRCRRTLCSDVQTSGFSVATLESGAPQRKAVSTSNDYAHLGRVLQTMVSREPSLGAKRVKEFTHVTTLQPSAPLAPENAHDDLMNAVRRRRHSNSFSNRPLSPKIVLETIDRHSPDTGFTKDIHV